MDPRYIKMFGLTRADHKMDGTRIKGFIEDYEDQVKALVEIICVKKKYASDELLENMYQAVKQGDQNWTPLILSSLRRMLIQMHASQTREIKGAELIDALLENWFPNEEEYVEPRPAQESDEEIEDGSKGQPDLTPVRRQGDLAPDDISGEGAGGAGGQILAKEPVNPTEEAEHQSSSSSWQPTKTRTKKRKRTPTPETPRNQGATLKRLRKQEHRPMYKDCSSGSLHPKVAEEVERGAILSDARRTPNIRSRKRAHQEKQAF